MLCLYMRKWRPFWLLRCKCLLDLHKLLLVHTALHLCQFSRIVFLNKQKLQDIYVFWGPFLIWRPYWILGQNQNGLLIKMSLEYKDLALCQFSQLFLKLNNRWVLFYLSAALVVYIFASDATRVVFGLLFIFGLINLPINEPHFIFGLINLRN